MDDPAYKLTTKQGSDVRITQRIDPIAGEWRGSIIPALDDLISDYSHILVYLYGGPPTDRIVVHRERVEERFPVHPW